MDEEDVKFYKECKQLENKLGDVMVGIPVGICASTLIDLLADVAMALEDVTIEQLKQDLDESYERALAHKEGRCGCSAHTTTATTTPSEPKDQPTRPRHKHRGVN